MAEVLLNTNAYIHKTAHEGRCAKFKSSFTRKRLPRGTKLQTMSDVTDVGGMTRVKIVLIDADAFVSVGGWSEGDIGYVRTAKLQLTSHSVMDSLKLSNPGGNGIGPVADQMGATEQDLYINEICVNLTYWSALDGILDLCLAREDNAQTWGKRVKALGALQILGGATMMGLSIAAVIVTAGAAAPLLAAFAVIAPTTGVIGIGAAGAKGRLMQGTGLSGDNTSWAASKNSGKAGLMMGAVTAGKKPVIEATMRAAVSGEVQQAAAIATANSASMVAGGAVAAYGGVSSIRVANKINPVAAWKAVDWQQVMTALSNDYIKIGDELEICKGDYNSGAILRERHFQVAQRELDNLIGKLAHALMESRNWLKSHEQKITTKGSLDTW